MKFFIIVLTSLISFSAMAETVECTFQDLKESPQANGTIFKLSVVSNLPDCAIAHLDNQCHKLARAKGRYGRTVDVHSRSVLSLLSLRFNGSMNVDSNEFQTNTEGGTHCLIGAVKMENGINWGYHIRKQGSFLVHRGFIPWGNSLLEGTLLAILRVVESIKGEQNITFVVKGEGMLKVLGRKEQLFRLVNRSVRELNKLGACSPLKRPPQRGARW